MCSTAQQLLHIAAALLYAAVEHHGLMQVVLMYVNLKAVQSRRGDSLYLFRLDHSNTLVSRSSTHSLPM